MKIELQEFVQTERQITYGELRKGYAKLKDGSTITVTREDQLMVCAAIHEKKDCHRKLNGHMLCQGCLKYHR